jgi:rhodanese-related sulfurtransferase
MLMLRGSRASRVVDVIIALTAIFTLTRYVVSTRAADTARADVSPPVQPGQPLRLEGVEWSAADHTVVVLVSPTCPACNASSAFFQRLTQAVRATPKARLAFIAAEPILDVEAWLQQRNISAQAVIHVSKPVSLGFFIVPSLVIVDSRGIVTDLMANRLTDGEQARVLARVTDPASPALNNAVAARELSKTDFEHLIASERPIVLDVRDRDSFHRASRPGAVNIPLDELALRAPFELANRTAVAIDCDGVPILSCRQAAMVLTDDGGRPVWLLPR